MGIIENEPNSRRTILRKAADLVRKSWGKHYLKTDNAEYGDNPDAEPDYTYCLLGAILEAEGRTRKFDDGTKSYQKANKLIGHRPDRYGYKVSPHEWNDFNAKDGNEVAKLLEELADNNMTWDEYCDKKEWTNKCL